MNQPHALFATLLALTVTLLLTLTPRPAVA